MTTRFTRLLTTNFLGYIHVGEMVNYFVSERSGDTLNFIYAELYDLVKVILQGKDSPLPHRETDVSVKFSRPAGQVTVSWRGMSGQDEEATFDEIRLMEILNIDMVRILVMNRQVEKTKISAQYL